jgi:hypothetical protein
MTDKGGKDLEHTYAHAQKDYFDPPPSPLIDIEEFGKWSFYRAIIAEFVATLLFLYITIGTVIGNKHGDDINGNCGGVGILGIAWAFGGMIFILVYCTAGISGMPLQRQLYQGGCRDSRNVRYIYNNNATLPRWWFKPQMFSCLFSSIVAALNSKSF